MIEVALFTGIGLLGYILSTQYTSDSASKKKEGFRDTPRSSTATLPASISPNAPLTEQVRLTNDTKGHNNMVPFFGARVTQNLRGGANDSILDTFSGTGSEYVQKREVQTFYDVKPGYGDPYGNPNESDFIQSRMVAGMSMKNVSPIEKTYVAPGLNNGYTNTGSGGYQQFTDAQQFAKPRTTDELRVDNKPKLSYEKPVVPGNYFVTQPGLQAPVMKNRPDTFNIMTEDGTIGGELTHLNTAVGVQVAPASFPEQMFKEQQRATTNIEYYGAGGAEHSFANYVRSFTEPFQEFMKLTVGEWVGVAGGQGGVSEGTYVVDQYNEAYTNPGREASSMTFYTAPGGIAFNSGSDAKGAVKVNKDEDMLYNVRTVEAAANVVSSASTAEQRGQMSYTLPLPLDAEINRVDPAILDAFKANPYTHSLQSVA
uniref:DUF5899 domain-containing protein n=1 Tax=viral metagenome TaxID=1070528 RepID=A0A6C0HLG3_9ZZZZ